MSPVRVWEEPPHIDSIEGAKPSFFIMNYEAKLPPRIIGTEMEYGRGPSTARGRFDLTDHLPSGLQSVGEFLSNGARFYKDIGDKLEYATPECYGVLDATAAEFAGHSIVFHAVEKLIRKRYIERVPLRKCAVDELGTTWGYHENYGMTRQDYQNRAHRAFLISHMASRTILVGAGRIIESSDGEPETAPAQKIHSAKVLESSSYLDKAIFNTRDEALSNRLLWARQHVVFGDPNITKRMTVLKLGSTSMVIRLGETGFGSDKQLPHNGANLALAHAVGNDSTGEQIFKNRMGEAVTALDIQENLLEQCENLAQEFELPQDELQTLILWRGVLDAAKNNPSKADKIIEWRAKKQLLQHYTASIGDEEDASRVVTMLNNAWDHLDPIKNIGNKWMQSDKDASIQDELIDAFTYDCPTSTRAFQRARFIRRNHSRSDNARMDWAGGVSRGKPILVPHPYGSKAPKVF